MLSTPSPLMLALRPQNSDCVISTASCRSSCLPMSVCHIKTGRLQAHWPGALKFGFDHYLAVMVHKLFPFRCNTDFSLHILIMESHRRRLRGIFSKGMFRQVATVRRNQSGFAEARHYNQNYNQNYNRYYNRAFRAIV